MRLASDTNKLKTVALPEIDLALSIAGTLGSDAGLLVEDVLNKCSGQSKGRENSVNKDPTSV